MEIRQYTYSALIATSMNYANRLLQKYLDGNCTTVEKKQLYQHLLRNRADDYDEVFQALWAELTQVSPPDSKVSDRMYQAILTNTQSTRKSSFQIRPWLVAASLTGTALLLGLLYFFFLNSSQIHETKFGEVKVIELPDGSTVHLNANSKLTYSSDYLATNDTREVWLSGEAYFEVIRRQNSANQPVKLTVHTAQVDIEVLGTAFNVKDRHNITRVVLDEGKVRLKSPKSDNELIAMAPGESVEVNEQQSFSIQKIAASEQVSSWKENELYFNDQPLHEIQQMLFDNYGLQLRFADPTLRELRFTGSTPTDDLLVLFTTLEKSFLLEITQHQNEYIIKRTQ